MDQEKLRMMKMIGDKARQWKREQMAAKYAPPTTDPDSLLKDSPNYKSSEMATMQPSELPEAAPSSDFTPPEAADVSDMKLPTANDALAQSTMNENRKALSGLDEERMQQLLASLKR